MACAWNVSLIGVGTEVNHELALEWLQKAAKLEIQYAVRLANWYLSPTAYSPSPQLRRSYDICM
jgi:TPR repeat protein